MGSDPLPQTLPAPRCLRDPLGSWPAPTACTLQEHSQQFLSDFLSPCKALGLCLLELSLGANSVSESALFLGSLELVPTQRLRIMWLLHACIREQSCHPSSLGFPLSLDAAHNKCHWQQSMTSAALSRGSGSNTALQLGRPQSVKNTAVPKPKTSVEAVEYASLIPLSGSGMRTWVRPDQKTCLGTLRVISRVLKQFFAPGFV